MSEAWILFVAVVLIGAVVLVVIARRRLVRPPAPPAVTDRIPTQTVEVTLPVEDADPTDPATQRLVADAGHRALAADPEATAVLVRSRAGSELGLVRRTEAPSPKPFVDLPQGLLEPQRPRHPGPRDPVEPKSGAATPANVRFSEEPRHAHRSLAEHFELPETVQRKITDPEDPVDIVRAILEASGARVSVDDNVIVQGDRALVVIRTPLHAAVGSESLNAAYLRFERSHVKRGAVVTPGTMYPHEVRRREALAPSLLHAGPDGIQRMADAVAMGADPLDFVVPAFNPR